MLENNKEQATSKWHHKLNRFLVDNIASLNAVIFILICVIGLIVGISAGFSAGGYGGYGGGGRVIAAGLFGFLGLVGGAITEII